MLGVLVPHWVDAALTVYHCETTRVRLSTHAEWRGHFDWYLNNPSLFTKRAIPYYIGMLCIPEAKLSPAPVRTCCFLVKEAVQRGRINLSAFAYLTLVTLTSRNWRGGVRGRWPFLRYMNSWKDRTNAPSLGTAPGE